MTLPGPGNDVVEPLPALWQEWSCIVYSDIIEREPFGPYRARVNNPH